MSLRSVVVVGAGLAGVTVCSGLRDRGYDGELVLLSDEAVEPYDRPPLSKELLLGEHQEIRLRDSAFYRDNAIDLRLSCAAVDLSPAESSVALAGGGSVRGDAVVLATGGRPRRLPVPGGEQGHVLRTIEDALRLREFLRPGARIVVVGGGLIGAEVASAAVAHGCQVVVTDPDPLPLAAAVGPYVSRWLVDEQIRAGVRVISAGVVEIGAEGRSVRVSDGTVLDADAAVTGVGIEPGTTLAAAAGLEVANGIMVDAAQRTSNPAVFAVGDAARVRDAPRVEHWDAAIQAGYAVAAALLGEPAPVRTAPWWWTDRHGHHVEVTGVVPKGHEPQLLGEPSEARFIAYWANDDGTLLAAVAVNQGRRSRIVRRLVQSGASVTELAE